MKCDFVNCRYYMNGRCDQRQEVVCKYSEAKENAAPERRRIVMGETRTVLIIDAKNKIEAITALNMMIDLINKNQHDGSISKKVIVKEETVMTENENN